MLIAIRSVTFIFLLITGGGCSDESPVADNKPAVAIQRTFASLRQVDSHPLFTMIFYADYDFGSRLAGRTRSQLLPPEHEPAAVKWACTCFSALGAGADAILGRNFDWSDSPALLLFTDPADGYASVSMVDVSYLGYHSETDFAGNLEPLLQSPYMPFDGMNERGLAVGMMAVPSANLAHDPAKVTLSSLEIIRLVLDYAATVDEAVSLIGQYNIDFGGGPPLHYLVADTSRRSAVIEFIDGRINLLENEKDWQVATNFLLTGHTVESARNACYRWRLAYDTLAGEQGAITSQAGLNLLEHVSQSNTRWSMIYNLTAGGLQVVMGRKYSTVLTYSLTQ